MVRQAETIAAKERQEAQAAAEATRAIAAHPAGIPTGWRGLADASNLVRDNTDALTACAEAAAKAKKDQDCTITLAAPASAQK